MNQVILSLTMNSESISLDNLMGNASLLKIIVNNRTEFYNRVDKINMNNAKIVSPEKAGRDHFALTDDITQPKSRQIDNLHVEQ